MLLCFTNPVGKNGNKKERKEKGREEKGKKINFFPSSFFIPVMICKNCCYVLH
jgi:hypothetical protein